MSENTVLWETGDEEIFTRIRLVETSSGVRMSITQRESLDDQWHNVNHIDLQTTLADLEVFLFTLSTFVKTVKANTQVK